MLGVGYNRGMKNTKACDQCGSLNTKTLEAGYNTVLWCGECGHEEHTPKPTKPAQKEEFDLEAFFGFSTP